LEALAVTDRNSVAGIVRAHEAATVTGGRLIVGCRLELMASSFGRSASTGRLHDGSDLLASLGQRGPFPLPDGRGDEVYRGSAPDARSPEVRAIYIPDLSLEAIRVRTRDFR